MGETIYACKVPQKTHNSFSDQISYLGRKKLDTNDEVSREAVSRLKGVQGRTPGNLRFYTS